MDAIRKICRDYFTTRQEPGAALDISIGSGAAESKASSFSIIRRYVTEQRSATPEIDRSNDAIICTAKAGPG